MSKDITASRSELLALCRNEVDREVVHSLFAELIVDRNIQRKETAKKHREEVKAAVLFYREHSK